MTETDILGLATLYVTWLIAVSALYSYVVCGLKSAGLAQLILVTMLGLTAIFLLAV